MDQGAKERGLAHGEEGLGDKRSSVMADYKARAEAETKHASEKHDEPTRPFYEDRYLTCTDTALTIRWYYFPAGTKHIPLRTIRRIDHVPMGVLTGRGRIWGTANPQVWAHLDPGRPGKTEALLLDIGGSVKPLVTAADLPALEQVLASCTGLTITEGPGGVA